jgi:RNA polymerase sigma-70 factor (ECF subfamily)
MENCPDEQLIATYFKGDEQALEILIRRYLKPIYSFVYRYMGNASEAEDITQEVFVKMWRHLKKFDKKKSFKTWIFSIAKNASIDFLRKKKTLPFSEFENEKGDNFLIDSLVDFAPLPNELFQQNNLAVLLSSAIEKLSPKYRMVLFLRYNDHFTFREIADSLGEPLETIKSRYRRGLVLLRKILIEDFR